MTRSCVRDDDTITVTLRAVLIEEEKAIVKHVWKRAIDY